jgi:hypothetical protein
MLLSVLLPYFTERRFKMFLKFVLLGISLTLIMFFFDVLVPKIKLKIRLHKELKDRKKKREAFKNKMKELEIK